MGFDFESLIAPRERWLDLEGPLKGVRILIRYASPNAGEEFQQILIRRGIIKRKEAGVYEFVETPSKVYLTEFCKHYVIDWQGVTKANGEPADYSPEAMASVMVAIRSVMDQVTAAVGRELDFFTRNGDGKS